MSIYMLVITWFMVVFTLFKSADATELNLNYNAEAIQSPLRQKTNDLNSQNKTSEAFKNMGADGRKKLLEADAKNKKKSEHQDKGKGKGKGKGNGRGKAQHS